MPATRVGSGRTLILSADHPDTSAYPTRTFAVKAATLPEVLVGQVVWVGRTVGHPLVGTAKSVPRWSCDRPGAAHRQR